MSDRAFLGDDSTVVVLELVKTTDRVFSFGWYEEDEVTLIPIDSVFGSIHDDEGAPLGDVADYCTINGDGTVDFDCTASDISSWPLVDHGKWSLGAVSTGGDRSRLFKGPVIVRAAEDF